MTDSAASPNNGMIAKAFDANGAPTTETVVALAHSFVRLIKAQFGEIEFAAIAGNCAATGDFDPPCDANMLMDEAFRATFGTGPLDHYDWSRDTDENTMSDSDLALWNAAWAFAVKEIIGKPTPPYQIAFPDYDPATMPPIPADWIDESWSNDACPSFTIGGLQIFVDFADKAVRELPDTDRFSVQSSDDDFYETIFGSDDWSEVLAFVAANPRPAPPPAPALAPKPAIIPAKPAPMTLQAAYADLRRVSGAARDMLAAHMSDTFGPDRDDWQETVFWETYEALNTALAVEPAR